jgi:hypothetical protein
VAIRHKCFISYHHADQAAARQFIDTFDENHDVFISRDITMPEDVVNSNDDDYVMSRIRSLYIRDSTVTIVLIGACTWTRQFVDWEVQASLRQPANGLPNGLTAILLDKDANQGKLPSRTKLNVDSQYAKFYSYPAGPNTLANWIDEAFNARATLASRIVNPRARQKGNLPCF